MHRAVSALRSTLGTMWYHNLASSIEQYRNYLLTTKAPLPSDGVMVNYGEKYRTLLEGVEIDDGVKESIRNFKKELEDPVKVADKFKALAEMYNKLISKLEEERKREIERARQQALARGNTSSFTGQRLASLLPSSQRTPSSPSPSASASVLANTPPTLRMPLTTIQSPPPVNSLTSPQKVRRTKLGLSRNIGGDDGGDDGDGSQINQQLFPHDENSTPPPSPTRTRSPAVVAPKSKNNNTAPFSPMRPLPPLIKHSSIYTVEYLNPHSGYKLQQRYQ
jgi:hypothetical protein